MFRRCAFRIIIYMALVTNVAANDANLEKIPAQILVENLKGTLAAAGVDRIRDINHSGLELLKAFEVWRPRPYNDAANYCSIGFGHIISLEPCEAIDTNRFSQGISLDQGVALLKEDSRYARLAVERLTERYLNDDQYSAVVAFVFNVGSEAFRDSKMRSLINQGEFSSAASEFAKWTKLGGKVIDALVLRRTCERKLYESRMTLNADGALAISNCN